MGRATELLYRLDAALQDVADGAFRRVPAPYGFSRLAPLRAAVASEILARRAADVAATHARFVAAGGALDSDGGRAVVRLAGELLAEMRATVVARSGARLLGAVAHLDSRLPTDRIEHVDDPTYEESRRTAAIVALDRLNRALGSYVRFLEALEPLLGEGTTTVLDVGSGHGGFALSLARLARRRGRRLRVIASDLRPEYVDIGRRSAAARGDKDVEFRVIDAFRLGDSLRPGEVDVITCTQTLHHFGAGLTAVLLAEAMRHARRGILFVDTARTLANLVAVGTAATVGSRDRSHFEDGTVSIRKSFVPEELWLLARCVPGGDALEAYFLPPGHAVLRSRVSARSAPGCAR